MIRSTSRRSIIVRELSIAAAVAFVGLIFLFIIYGGLESSSLTKFQVAVGMIPSMITIMIWRNYIYNRMHPQQHKHHKNHDSHNNNIDDDGQPYEEIKEHRVIQQMFPYLYPLSCILLFYGNMMLPMQVMFSSKLLDPKTGDPYQFNIVCALCYGFVFTMIGLNMLLDTIIFITRKIVEWTNNIISQQIIHRHHHVLLWNSNMMRRQEQFRRFRAPLMFLLSIKIVLGGALIAKEDPIVVQITVPISSQLLPNSLDNFRIIHLSDVHIGVTVGRSRVKKIVDIVNDLCSGNDDKCDLIAITGDLIDGEPSGLTKAIEPLVELCHDDDDNAVAKVFVPGNHEHIHHNIDHVVTVLSTMGIESLINNSIRLPRNAATENQLVLVGLDDLSSRQSRGKEWKAFEGIDSEKDAIILLAHQPNHLKVAERYGVDLMLSGHTHAGQFFPGTVGAWLFNSRYSGYYPPRRASKPAVYVSAGTLWWGPPIRLTTRHHEITDIRLVRSQ